jgi:hypothetical protein
MQTELRIHQPPAENIVQEHNGHDDLKWDVQYCTKAHVRKHTSTCSGCDLPAIRKSRPSVILLKSVVTRLLIFPTKLSALECFFLEEVSESSLASCAFCLPFFTEDVDIVSALVCSVSSLLPSVLSSRATVLDPATDAVSGVDVPVESPDFLASSGSSAFIRIRSACSKTSCVRIPSVRTRTRV